MTKRYWWVIISYIIMQFSGLLFAPLLYILLPLTEHQAVVYWSIISFILGLVVVLFLMKPEMKKGSQRDASTGGEIVAWSIIGLIMAFLAQGISATIEMKVFGITQSSENTKLIMDVTRATPLFMVIPALIAPILEEIIFRKIIFGQLYLRTNFIIAALLSALIFEIIHGEPQHLLVYASMGFVFAFLYVKTKRIIVPIIVHMAMNTTVVLAQFNIDPKELEQQLEQLQAIIFGG
ncbi:CPBP family intramembrane glutamic endopeptidase [Virgibacillus halodenitrificans]|uniref:CPBP family intramembrane glutamic endopeptidase n=1 Tax=Virgibacillus halodenitrificans TaxID=1482 RepID=UPI00045CC9D8|nr:type II CAAX endopeptidase family protein [Virgibacillus halodenitrificans]CDQ36858.1 CAAX amino terminal protease self-immunity [Virgibacillus halodenitrificans]